MKAFRYKLERVLDIRKLEQEQIEMKLAAIVMELNNLLEEKEKTLNEKEETFNMWQKAQEGRLNIADLIAYQNRIIKINLNIEGLDGKIQKTKEGIEKVREELIEASRKSKILEQLKEKKFAEYRFEMEKEEQGILDEIGQNIFIRNGKKNEEESIK